MGEIDWRKVKGNWETLENESMARHTTFRCGGQARWLLKPGNVQETAEILKICNENGVKPFFLGNGSNLLVREEGVQGVLISSEKLDFLEEKEGLFLAQSGVLMPRLAIYAGENQGSGLEFAGGIPGSVGGGVRMNAGAYGGELGDKIVWVEYLDQTGQLHRRSKEECDFRYRHSIFCENPWFITRAAFQLEKGNGKTIRQTMAELNQKRREKQPLEYPSAGSTFKRPQGHFAAALIDQCGLKGFTVGGAQVSEKHAGFVINRKNATATDVLTLMEEVTKRVKEQTGITLEPEVEILPKEV